MSVLSVMERRPDQPVFQKRAPASQQDDAPPPSTIEAIGAGFREAKDRIPFLQEQRLQQAYFPVLRAVTELNGKSVNAYTAPLKLLNPFANDKTDYDALWQDIASIRARDPKALSGLPASRAEFEGAVLTRNGQHTADAAVAARGGLVPRLIGGAGASFFDPANTALGLVTGGASKGMGAVRGILTEGLANAGIEAVETPANIAAQHRLGEAVTPGDVATNIGSAFVFGAALHGTGMVARGGFDALPSGVQDALRLEGADLRTMGDASLARTFADKVPPAMRTPDEQAAVSVALREGEIEASSPYAPSHEGFAVHRESLQQATDALTGVAQVARPRPAGGAIGDYIARAMHQESRGDAAARSTSSSASGLFGFTDDTWVRTYQREFPNSGLSREAILGRKGEKDLQLRLMQRLTQDNAYWLGRHGLPSDDGNLYVVHHLGQGDAGKVFSARPETPLAEILSPKVMKANPHLRDKTAGEFIGWAHDRMGQPGGAGGEFAGGGASAADGELADALQGERADVAMRQQALDGERARLDAEDGTPEAELPLLRREEFPDESSWRVAQAESDARLLGTDPVVTRQTIWEDAREQLMRERSGEVAGALWHPDLGPVDVKWGDEKTGLAKIVAKHEEVLDNLPELLAQMEVVDRTPNRVQLESMDHAAAVRLDWNGEKQHWLLTAFERDPSKVARALENGEVPSPAVYRRAGDSAGASPTAGTMGEIALRAHGINPADARSLDMQWGWHLDRGDAPRPIYAIIDGDRRMVHWETSQSRAERQMAKRGIEGGHVVRINPPTPIEMLAADPRLGDDVAARFADPAGPDAQLQADGLAHDVKAAIDSGSVEGVNFATDDGSAPESVRVTMAKLEADEAALKALRGCL